MQRHSFDLISAGFGAVFIWIGFVALIPDFAVPAATIWPVLAVAAGVAVLVTALRAAREDDAVPDIETDD